MTAADSKRAVGAATQDRTLNSLYWQATATWRGGTARMANG